MKKSVLFIMAVIFLNSCGVELDSQTAHKITMACEKMIEAKNQGTVVPKINLAVILAPLAESQGPKDNNNNEYVGTVQQGLNIFKSSLWPLGEKINVCWENVDPNSEEAMRVKASIDRTWNALFSSADVQKNQGVLFTGWGTCQKSDVGIRIKVDDVGPHTRDLGKNLKYLSSNMVLNFTFNHWSEDCRTEKSSDKERLDCIDYVAVHEFGHALGMSHEQNRLDTPTKDCDQAKQGTDGDTTFGPWDAYSVMNYCSKEWNASGKLSAIDKIGMRYFYAPIVGIEFCQDILATVKEQVTHYKDKNIGDQVLNIFTEIFKD